MLKKELFLGTSSDELKGKAKTIWSETFSDSEKYIEYYFNSRYFDENFFSYKNEKGEIISSFHLNPYSIATGEEKIESCYLIAAATHKDYRKLGLFRSLLLEVFESIREKASIVFLHPAILNFYEQFDFAPSHYLRKLTINTDDLPEYKKDKENICYNTLKTSEVLMYKDFSNKFSKNLGDSYIYKTKKNITDILEEIHLENGEVINFENTVSGECGYFSYTSNEDAELIVKDIIINNSFINSPLISMDLRDSGIINSDLINSYITYIFRYFKEQFPKTKIIFNLPIILSETELEKLINGDTTEKNNFQNKKNQKYTTEVEEYLLSRILNLEKIGSQYFRYIFNKMELNSKLKNRLNREIMFSVSISDKLIPKNNITFILDLENKKIDRVISNDKHRKDNENIPGISLEISTFTTLIFNSDALKKALNKKEHKNKIERINSPEEEVILSLFTAVPGYIYQDV